MALVNYARREIQFKVVYFGPGLGGKTTNLAYIHQHTPPQYRGNMVSLKTEEERTLFFDFLPVALGEVGGYRARFMLYTVPGQVIYKASRRVILQGTDAVVFVADSTPFRHDGNRASWRDLQRMSEDLGLDLHDMPLIYQWNKRDLEITTPVERLEADLNPWGRQSFQAVAVRGEGVMDTLKATLRGALRQFQEASAPRPQPEPQAAGVP